MQKDQCSPRLKAAVLAPKGKIQSQCKGLPSQDQNACMRKAFYMHETHTWTHSTVHTYMHMHIQNCTCTPHIETHTHTRACRKFKKHKSSITLGKIKYILLGAPSQSIMLCYYKFQEYVLLGKGKLERFEYRGKRNE